MKKLIIMRSLPGGGKTFTAKKLAGKKGIILSTDDYWYQVVNPKKPKEYSFDYQLLGKAHRWNYGRFKELVDKRKPLIIIDNTNIRWKDFKDYVKYVQGKSYEVELQEPESPWWKYYRPMLCDKENHEKELRNFAKLLYGQPSDKQKYMFKGLAKGNSHNVPLATIESMIEKWQEIQLNSDLNFS